MTRRVHHAVYCLQPEHLEHAVSVWSEVLGVEFSEYAGNPGLRVFYAPDAGLELIAPVPDSGQVPPRIAAFAAGQGEGLYTLVFEVPGIDEASSAASARGIAVDNELRYPTIDEADLPELYGMRMTLAEVHQAPA
jgi:hypothetical protein